MFSYFRIDLFGRIKKSETQGQLSIDNNIILTLIVDGRLRNAVNYSIAEPRTIQAYQFQTVSSNRSHSFSCRTLLFSQIYWIDPIYGRKFLTNWLPTSNREHDSKEDKTRNSSINTATTLCSIAYPNHTDQDGGGKHNFFVRYGPGSSLCENVRNR